MSPIKMFPFAMFATVGTLFLTTLGLQSTSTGMPRAARSLGLELPSLDAFLDAAARDMYTVDGESPLRRRPLAELPKLPFIHVPKTAGTWFRKALDGAAKRAVPGQLAEYYLQNETPPLDARWLYGHLVNLSTFDEFDTVHVTWVRRPMQRLISTYFFHLREYDLFKKLNQSLPWHLHYVRAGMPAEEWIKESVAHTQWMTDNLGGSTKPPHAAGTDRALRQALSQPHMEPFRVLFPSSSLRDLANERDRLRVMYQLRTFPLVVERFKDSVKAFSRALFDDKGAYEAELLEDMRNPKNAAPKNEKDKTLSWGDVAKFEEASWADLIHYEVALETFERNLRYIVAGPVLTAG